jgi:uncharacterized SAM-binding protein YcdF (DUF218 family)
MKILRVVGACAALAFLVAAFTPLANVLHQRFRIGASPEPAGAIVVLGSDVGADGVLGDNSLRRLVQGVSLYHRGFAPRLVLLGTRNRSGVVEAEVRARLARELDVPRTAVLTDVQGRDTMEEAAGSARLLQPLGVHKVLLVTGHYHMPRARRLFEKAGFEVVPSAADEFSGADGRPEGRLRILRTLGTEAVARLYNRIRGRL